MADQIISQEYLHTLFDYKDGHLHWKNKTVDFLGRSKSHFNGKPAGTLNNNGYYRVMLNKKNYLIHRLIYLYHNGFMPNFLDHIDNNPLNNCIENLRPATKSQNCRNQKTPKNNKSGVKGVIWHKTHKKWMAYLQTLEKRHTIGYFDKIENAKIAIIKARNKYHGEFARHS